MRKLGLAVLAIALWAAPRPASADFFVEGSLGVPWRTSPSISRDPTNVLITPGYEFFDLVSLELGFLGNIAGYQQPGGWGLRPMIGLRPPILPVYAKLIFDFNDLGHQSVSTVGGAVGLTFPMGPLHLFAEGDYLPRSVAGINTNVLEARLGIGFSL